MLYTGSPEYDHQTAEWTVHLVECQLKATLMLEPGELQERLLKAITGIQASIFCDHQILPVEFMNCIEKVLVFSDLGKLKLSEEHNFVKSMVKG